MAEGEIIAICFHNNELSDCEEGERVIDRNYIISTATGRSMMSSERSEYAKETVKTAKRNSCMSNAKRDY